MKKIFILLLSLMPILIFSQQSWQVGLQLGANSYQGDLRDPSLASLKLAKPAFGFTLGKELAPQWAIRLQAAFGELSGDDLENPESELYQRKFSFTTPLSTASFRIEWDMFGYRRYQRIRGVIDAYSEDNTKLPQAYLFTRKFSPYFYTGWGYTGVNPTTNYNEGGDVEPELIPLIAKDKLNAGKKTLFTFSFGMGVHYDLSEKIIIGAESTFYYPFNDYLDGVKYSGNPDEKDWFVSGMLNATYRLLDKDKDNDGIKDIDDACPLMPGPKESNGCPDTDKDGVADNTDRCPLEPGVANLFGCPIKDADGDGIYDDKDDCVDVPGIPKFNGCPDTDKDGVMDKEDECPEERGLSELKGCPDSDRDGIADKDDICPNEAGELRTRGCPDKDKDGVADKDDLCPTVPGVVGNKGCPAPIADRDMDGVADSKDDCIDVFGLERYAGCPDSDNDGIRDKDDKCPNEAGSASKAGCPDGTQELILENRVVYFDVAMDKVTADFQAEIDYIVKIMTDNPTIKVRVQGHTDNSGNAPSNLILSKKRAEFCASKLIERGIPSSRITTEGLGENRPVVDNGTPEGRKINRRVELILYK